MRIGRLITDSIIKVSGLIIGEKKNIQNEGCFDQDCKNAITEKNRARNIYLQSGIRQRKENMKGKVELQPNYVGVNRKKWFVIS
jgi:hypothetical protein